MKAAYDFKEIQNAKSEVVNGMLLFTIQNDLCFAKQFFLNAITNAFAALQT